MRDSRHRPHRQAPAAAPRPTPPAVLEPSAVQSRIIRIADYDPNPRNYNRHPDTQIQAIALSLQKFGQPRPVVVWRKWYLAGHGVIEGAKLLGWEQIRADVLPDEYPEHLALAYVAADNELSRLSDPDEAALAAIITESAAIDADLIAAIGYTADEYDRLLARVEAGRKGQETGDPEPRIDAAEELRQEWQTAPGQLWRLGLHRLLCGESSRPAAWQRLMQGQQADLLWTDPPYGVDYSAKNEYLNRIDKGNRIQTPIENDAGSREEMIALWLSVFGLAAQHSRPGACFYSAGPPGELLEPLMYSIRSAGWDIRQQLIWVKNNSVLSFADHHYRHEPIIYGWKPGAGHTWTDEAPHTSVIDDDTDPKTLDKAGLIALVADLRNAARTTVLRVPKPQASEYHPTTKPTKLIRITATNNTHPGDLWIDPFSGSGSTLIAAEQTGRRCYASEKQPGYVAVTLQRFYEATGTRPQLEEAGK